MRFLSLFSGIEAASLAWVPLGWEPVAFAEVDSFANAVLKFHYPSVPNLGNVVNITAEQVRALGKIDLVIGGFPCQDLSVAGKRAGFNNDDGSLTRSGLFFEAIRLVRAADPRWLVIENVPGLFSSNDGRDFAAVVGAILGVGFDVPPGGWRNAGAAASARGMVEWSTLDAQWFGLAQRRKRVFLVADFGDWTARRPVLLERESLLRHPAPRRGQGKNVAGSLSARASAGGGFGADFECSGGLQAFGGNRTSGGIDVAAALNAKGGVGRMDFETETLITHSLRGEGHDASEDGTGRGVPLVPMAFHARQDPDVSGDVTHPLDTDGTSIAIAFSAKDNGRDATYGLAPTLRAMPHRGSHANGGGQMAVAFAENSRAEVRLEGGDGATTGSLKTGGGKPGQSYPVAMTGMAVRRLTPAECARLQGFPDDYLAIPYRGKPAADGPRYRALGNSIAVPVLRWIGERISKEDAT